MNLVDQRGIPIEMKEEAEYKLKEFISKHSSRWQDWFREFGTTAIFANDSSRFPVAFDPKRREWYWK